VHLSPLAGGVIRGELSEHIALKWARNVLEDVVIVHITRVFIVMSNVEHNE
jgi:hypothetical protein